MPLPRRRRRNNKEDITQTLQLPKELPGAVTGETRRLTFYVTPLSARGLLSAQVRDALKALMHDTGGSPVLKIRAFVAGSGDLRRVRDLVSEVFNDKHLPLPALSLIQSGGLPLEGAQVVLEGIAAAKKEVNPQGLVFLGAHGGNLGEPARPGGAADREIARGLEGGAQSRRFASPATWCGSPASSVRWRTWRRPANWWRPSYPHAALNYVQTQRVPFTGTGGLRGGGAPALEDGHTAALRAGRRRTAVGAGGGKTRGADRDAGELWLSGGQFPAGF